LFMASHSAEPRHLELLEEIIAITGASAVTESFDSISTGTLTLPLGWKMSAAAAGSSAGYNDAGNFVTLSTSQATSDTVPSAGRILWAPQSGNDRSIGFYTSAGYGSPSPEDVGQHRAITVGKPGLEGRPGPIHREFVGIPRGKVVEPSPQPTGSRPLPVGKPQSGHDPGEGGRQPLGKDRQPCFEGRFVERLDDAGGLQPSPLGLGVPFRWREFGEDDRGEPGLGKELESPAAPPTREHRP
jgi:hypothetical protein